MNKKTTKIILILLIAMIAIVLLILLAKSCSPEDDRQESLPETAESISLETEPESTEITSISESFREEDTTDTIAEATEVPVTSSEENKPTEAPTPTEIPKHEHTWEPVTQTVHHDAVYETQIRTVHHEATYKTVHHEATGHYEDVLVQESTPGYDEPIYETHSFCTVCGVDLTSAGISVVVHAFQAHDGASGYTNRDVQVGTTHHEGTPAKYEQQWVEDSPAYDEQVVDQPAWDEPISEQVKVQDAWDEEVVTGYRCSGCGAVK